VDKWFRISCPNPHSAGDDLQRRQALTALCLTSLMAAGVLLGWFHWSEPAAVDSGAAASRTASIRIGIDPRTADWCDWAQLPGIGETLGRRIVDWRDGRGGGDPATPNQLEKPADLLRVRGMGPKRLAAIAPFLRFEARH